MNLAFETREAESECVTDEPVAEPKAPAGLAITAEVLEKTVKVGGRMTVVVKMTNTTAAPMQVYVDLTCDDVPGVPLQIFDAAGKRADWTPHKNCIRHAPPNCERRVLRIVLEPGGSMTKKRDHLALWQKATAECGVTFGTLKAGNYAVRVMTGFYRDAERVFGEATFGVD